MERTISKMEPEGGSGREGVEDKNSSKGWSGRMKKRDAAVTVGRRKGWKAVGERREGRKERK